MPGPVVQDQEDDHQQQQLNFIKEQRKFEKDDEGIVEEVKDEQDDYNDDDEDDDTPMDGVTKSKAVKALKTHNGDIVSAIMNLPPRGLACSSILGDQTS